MRQLIPMTHASGGRVSWNQRSQDNYQRVVQVLSKIVIFPFMSCKMSTFELEFGHYLMICFTLPLIHHWRTRWSLGVGWGGPLPLGVSADLMVR